MTPSTSPNQSPKSTPKRKNRSQSPPPRSMTPKTTAVVSALSGMTMSSPDRIRSQIRRKLNFVENAMKMNIRTAQNAIKAAYEKRKKEAMNRALKLKAEAQAKQKQAKNKNNSKK